MIGHLRRDDVGEQATADAALGDRFGRRSRLGDLRIETPRFATPASVSGADQFADEDRRRLVIEAFADDLTDAALRLAAAGAELLGFVQIDLFPAPRQILRLTAAAVPLPLRRGRRFGDRFGSGWLHRRRRLGVGQIQPVEQGRAFDPLAAPAERHLHQAVDVGLLRLDLLEEVGHHLAEFGDDGVGVGQLPAEAIDVVGRRHAGLNTAEWSR